jgi:hypothetical protein
VGRPKLGRALEPDRPLLLLRQARAARRLRVPRGPLNHEAHLIVDCFREHGIELRWCPQCDCDTLQWPTTPELWKEPRGTLGCFQCKLAANQCASCTELFWDLGDRVQTWRKGKCRNCFLGRLSGRSEPLCERCDERPVLKGELLCVTCFFAAVGEGPRLCKNCGRGKAVAKGECRRCYNHRRRTGTARPAELYETDPTLDEARVARKNLNWRQEQAKTCKRGHPFAKENTHVRADGTCVCRTCHREQEAERRKKKGK